MSITKEHLEGKARHALIRRGALGRTYTYTHRKRWAGGENIVTVFCSESGLYLQGYEDAVIGKFVTTYFGPKQP